MEGPFAEVRAGITSGQDAPDRIRAARSREPEAARRGYEFTGDLLFRAVNDGGSTSENLAAKQFLRNRVEVDPFEDVVTLSIAPWTPSHTKIIPAIHPLACAEEGRLKVPQIAGLSGILGKLTEIGGGHHRDKMKFVAIAPDF